MSIADYLRELLVQNNEVSVPGLGMFSLKRKNAYYNEAEARFYPPHHQVKFCTQPKDDDNSFVEYIAERKNILLSTANYLVEKYVGDLNLQAAGEDVALADMGWFLQENGQLAFKPNDTLSIDPAFYGYAPITLDKVRTEQLPRHVPATPVYLPAVIPNQLTKKEAYFQEKEKNKINTWFVVAVAAVLAALVVAGVFILSPSTYHTVSTIVTDNKEADTPVLLPGHKRNKIAEVSTSTEGPADTVKNARFEIIEDSFRTLPYASAKVKSLKDSGIAAKIITDDIGPLLKVSVGTFSNYAQADSTLKKLLRSGKINKKSHIALITTPK